MGVSFWQECTATLRNTRSDITDCSFCGHTICKNRRRCCKYRRGYECCKHCYAAICEIDDVHQSGIWTSRDLEVDGESKTLYYRDVELTQDPRGPIEEDEKEQPNT